MLRKADKTTGQRFCGCFVLLSEYTPVHVTRLAVQSWHVTDSGWAGVLGVWHACGFEVTRSCRHLTRVEIVVTMRCIN